MVFRLRDDDVEKTGDEDEEEENKLKKKKTKFLTTSIYV